jgi:hypothetical protein
MKEKQMQPPKSESGNSLKKHSSAWWSQPKPVSSWMKSWFSDDKFDVFDDLEKRYFFGEFNGLSVEGEVGWSPLYSGNILSIYFRIYVGDYLLTSSHTLGVTDHSSPISTFYNQAMIMPRGSKLEASNEVCEYFVSKESDKLIKAITTEYKYV